VELPRVAPPTGVAPAPSTATPVAPPAAGAPDESATTPPVVAPAAAPAANVPGGLAARTGGSPGQGSAAPTTEGVTPTEPIAPTVDEPIAVSILAREECWLSLSIDGQKVIGRNLQPGERVQYRAKRAADVSLGNAGAIDLMINGKPAKPLGARGQVVTKTITAETIKSLIQ
jgi:cytoskeleton protein RodZ